MPLHNARLSCETRNCCVVLFTTFDRASTYSLDFRIKMADARVVLCDPLCFIVNKYGKTDVKALSSALFDFYSTDVLSDAKKRLLDDVDMLNLKSKRPHIPHRRDGDGRLQKEVDDILLLVNYLDEQKALDSLPKYVSGSPDNMPSLRLYEGDISGLMTLLHSMSHKITEFGSALAAITRDVRTLQQAISPESTHGRAPAVNTRSTTADCSIYNHGVGQRGVSEGLPGDCETAVAITDRNVDCQSAAATSWALQVSTPICSGNRFAALSTDDDDHQQSQQPFTTVVHSRRTKRRQRSSSSQQQQQQQQPRQQRPQQPSTAATRQQPHTASTRRAPTLFGKSTTTSTITAARKLCKKSVFCVDNVVTSCTINDIRSFVEGLNVQVISCFETNPRRRPHESVESTVDRKAFRVCINDDNRQQFLDPTVWPDSISISDWFFKGRNANVNANVNASEKRRRVNSNNADPVRGPQSTNHTNQASASCYPDNQASAAMATDVAELPATGSSLHDAHEGDAMSEDETILADLSLRQ